MHLYSPETADPSDERRGGPGDPDPLLHDELVRIVVLLGARFSASHDCCILYRAEKKSWHMVARNFSQLSLNFSSWPCLGPA